MKLTVRIKDLESKGACGDGIDAFRAQYGETAEIDWNREAQVELLKTPLRKYFGWAWRNNILPMWNLSGANLYGANLYGADLYGANLYGANLYGADLRSADLRSANLYGADLSGANLYGANLRSADLRSAKLYGADLRSANLYGADLSGANLYGAKNIEHAHLEGAIGLPEWVAAKATAKKEGE